MHTDIALRRRVLQRAYLRYQAADQAWTIAVRDVRAWFPAESKPGRWVIGDPGSTIRRLYEKRERARMRLEAAYLKLQVARRRMTQQRTSEPPRVTLLIAAQM
ncbi:hypothetical protein [Roseobacter ponti]|uniref:Uncharacterized protein n=1 Tax=Roseobacter ponti TaxID=1891787 RepID=A0A858SUH3_9RHOB|nr:hypothetical protein [Roseobacter ponti]QJF52354.1 hypothetical protein G3256_14810 [Roseobacter ponti]